MVLSTAYGETCVAKYVRPSYTLDMVVSTRRRFSYQWQAWLDAGVGLIFAVTQVDELQLLLATCMFLEPCGSGCSSRLDPLHASEWTSET